MTDQVQNMFAMISQTHWFVNGDSRLMDYDGPRYLKGRLLTQKKIINQIQSSIIDQ